MSRDATTPEARIDISTGWCAPMPDSERLSLITTMGMGALGGSKETDESA